MDSAAARGYDTTLQLNDDDAVRWRHLRHQSRTAGKLKPSPRPRKGRPLVINGAMFHRLLVRQALWAMSKR